MDKRLIKNISVIGGGTAGWLSALYVKAIMPTKVVTVIESDEIGILGAGEGSVPNMISLLDVLDIPLSRLVKETSTTIKNGIKFTNWNNGGDRDFYYHPFNTFGDISPNYLDLDVHVSSGPSIFAAAVEANDSTFESDFMAKLSESGKVPFLRDDKQPRRTNLTNPIQSFDRVGAFSIHFDAARLAEFLKEVAIERGVIRVEGIIESFTEGEDGEVNTLVLKSGDLVNTDFVFDCSGFKRFFNKAFDTEWISYSDHLPVNAAVPFFLPMEEDGIPPYTESIAMKYGWMWKIPLQHRYGCGYVFNSSLITAEEAKAEIEDYLGHEIESPRIISFEAGYYKKAWTKNVISVGLSSGFVEPLEATSIWVALMTLKNVLSNTEVLYTKDTRFVDEFNERFEQINAQVLDFIYFHYMTDRNDTEFWQGFTYEKAPEGLKKFLDILEYRLPEHDDNLRYHLWPINSWYYIGLGLRNKKMIEHLKLSDFYNPGNKHYKSNYGLFKNNQDRLVDEYSIDHKKLLEEIKED